MVNIVIQLSRNIAKRLWIVASKKVAGKSFMEME